ncbi:ferritin-like protein [Streptomyces buecherae]|uniref:ferritin-like protein n=1 Tax=Streptomyces buecherae TaxID=2763006 RepID=UPI0037B2C816
MTATAPTQAPRLAAPPFTPPEPLVPTRRIETYEELVSHLHAAAKVEMCTIGPYLYAAYSIKTRGYSQWSPGIGALRTLLGIAVEEMLHLCLARNVLVGIGAGDRIRFCDANFVPTFPSDLPHRHPALPLALGPLSTDLVRSTFLEIEKPHKVPASDDLPAGQEVADGIVHKDGDVWEYATIGELYRRVIEGVKHLDGKGEIPWNKDGARGCQYNRGFWNEYGGGKPVIVTDQKTALQALNIIIDQGEGADPSKGTVPKNPNNPRPGLEEYTHFERFNRMLRHIEGIGIVDGTREAEVNIDSDLAVEQTLATSPHLKDYQGLPIHRPLALFNAAFTYMLRLLDQVYATPVADARWVNDPKRYHMERVFIAVMQGVLYPVAELLVSTPLPMKHARVGPPFEFYAFSTDPRDGDMRDQLVALCQQALPDFPQLGGDDGVLRQIDLLVPGLLPA